MGKHWGEKIPGSMAIAYRRYNNLGNQDDRHRWIQGTKAIAGTLSFCLLFLFSFEHWLGSQTGSFSVVAVGECSVLTELAICTPRTRD